MYYGVAFLFLHGQEWIKHTMVKSLRAHAFSKISLECGLGSPIQTSGSTTPWKDSQDSEKAVTLTIKVYYSERIQSQISKREKACEKSRGDQVQASKSPLPVESHEMQLIPPATSCEHTSEMSSSLLET